MTPSYSPQAYVFTSPSTVRSGAKAVVGADARSLGVFVFNWSREANKHQMDL
jgi:hypothetical protein